MAFLYGVDPEEYYAERDYVRQTLRELCEENTRLRAALVELLDVAQSVDGTSRGTRAVAAARAAVGIPQESMSDEHVHEWAFDFRIPVLAVNPPIYTFRCSVCGETEERAADVSTPEEPKP